MLLSRCWCPSGPIGSKLQKCASSRYLLEQLPNNLPSLIVFWSQTDVACMAWNKAIPDLLAVGYGSLNFHKEGGTAWHCTSKSEDNSCLARWNYLEC
eukprot:scaffold34203_cov18-Tisochrysis_lutea.AAC.2